jgi:hypothetical protein
MLRWLTQMEKTGQLRAPALPLSAAAKAMAALNSATITNWMKGDLALDKLREELVVGAALMLLGIVATEERARIERWLETYLATSAGDASPAAHRAPVL